MIKLIITGGTIDKSYNELNGKLELPQTHISEMLKQARCRVEVECQTLMLKDSLDMTMADRDAIKQACSVTKEKHIIITHGTDTMVDTAKYLASSQQGKVVVLVGAMVPYKVNNSDALFNLGCSVTAVQLLTEGIYITMNGKVFAWNKVYKDRKEGIFKG